MARSSDNNRLPAPEVLRSLVHGGEKSVLTIPYMGVVKEPITTSTGHEVSRPGDLTNRALERAMQRQATIPAHRK